MTTVLEEATTFYGRQRRLTARAIARIVALWGTRPPVDFDLWFAEHADEFVQILTAAQESAVGQGFEYVGAALAAGGGDIAPDADPLGDNLVGVAGDGRPLDTLMYGAVIHAKAAIAKAPDGKDPNVIRRAWSENGVAALITRAQTAIADAGRAATGLGTAARPHTGYTRLLVGSSCSRCAVLAGRTYGSMTAFKRHPRCDCRHVPRHSSGLADHALDVRAFFESLSTAEQDAKFTQAGAQAIRDGADPAQVVNARRGAAGLESAAGRVTAAEQAAIGSGRLRNTTLPGGRAVATTSEAMTKRGRAYKTIARGDVRREAEIKAGTRPRLMPEAIYEVVESREEALRLLRLNGYLL
ncbi:VG15 protein [Gordonia sputi]